MSLRTLGIASAICAAASYGAYWEHEKIDPVADARADRLSQEQMAQSVAQSSMQEQYQCLADDPTAWCNQDLTYADHLRGARATVKKMSGPYNVSNAQDGRMRNVYALIALIAGWVVVSQLRQL